MLSEEEKEEYIKNVIALRKDRANCTIKDYDKKVIKEVWPELPEDEAKKLAANIMLIFRMTEAVESFVPPQGILNLHEFLKKYGKKMVGDEESKILAIEILNRERKEKSPNIEILF